MSMLSGNNDSLRDRDLLGAQVNPGEDYEPDHEADPTQMPDWDDDQGVIFDDAPAVNDSLERESGSEADVVDQFREEEMDESEYDK
ncbi:MAG TPA: hypothetical protein VK096_01645 [Actinomycetales bacterium]|nr:hypothetical protein [Actinomycetales bacterium]